MPLYIKVSIFIKTFIYKVAFICKHTSICSHHINPAVVEISRGMFGLNTDEKYPYRHFIIDERGISVTHYICNDISQHYSIIK